MRRVSILSYLVCELLLFHSVSAFIPQTNLLGQSRETNLLHKCWSLHAKTKTADKTDTRSKRVSNLQEWAKNEGIKIGGVEIRSSSSSDLGLFATQNLNPSDIVLEVPTDLALSVQSPRDSNEKMINLFPSERSDVYKQAPWFAQLSLQLNALDKNMLSEKSSTMRTWLDCLPRKFITPIHWTEEMLEQLQYPFMVTSVKRQQTLWRKDFFKIQMTAPRFSEMTWEDFLWGCECARSRAFSGSYAGSTFNPLPYAFTVLLVIAYVGLNFGTLEQAANGAAVVLCASILKDFVVPKFLKLRRYTICPIIDMANHVGINESGNVALEYFANGYSLSITQNVPTDSQVFITYGARSNDQLLQYYGFVEVDNVHDVYIMPPLRAWDIDKLEAACGVTISAAKLQKLDQMGLLGPQLDTTASSDDDNVINNGVVITRAVGLDPAIMQALRVMVSSETEWQDANESIGSFSQEFSVENERLAKLAARTAIEMEILSKPTTIEQDEQLLKTMRASKSLDASEEEMLAVIFRLEKKKLLEECMKKLQ